MSRITIKQENNFPTFAEIEIGGCVYLNDRLYMKLSSKSAFDFDVYDIVVLKEDGQVTPVEATLTYKVL